MAEEIEKKEDFSEEIAALEKELEEIGIVGGSKFNNKKVREKIIECKKNGLTDSEACTYAGITVTALTRWKNKAKIYAKNGKEAYKPYYLFLQQLKHAELNLKELSLQTIKHSLTEEKDAKTAMWYLERKYKDEYGKEDNSKNGLPQMNIKIEKVYMNTEPKNEPADNNYLDAEIIENGEDETDESL
jgi:hypothetical protein